MQARRVAYEISSEKVKHRAERQDQNETFALLPSFLQGHTSIDTVSSGFLLSRFRPKSSGGNLLGHRGVV
jgi:hypothetical protein